MVNQLDLLSYRDLATFSPSGLDAAVSKIQQNLHEFRDRFAEFLAVLREAASRFASSAWTDINAAINELLTLGHNILATVTDLVKGAKSPMAMYHDALEWQNIRRVALELGDGVDAANLNPDARWTGRAYTSVWTGLAADAYNSTVPYQQRAALRIAAIADQAAASMQTCAAMGLTFYTGLAQLMVSGVTAVVAFISSVRGNPLQALNAAQALAGRVHDLLQSVITLASQLTQAINAQAVQVAALTAVTSTNNDFPGGRWPDPTGYGKWPKVIDGRVQVAP